MTDKSREAFEELIENKGYNTQSHHGEYWNDKTQVAWIAWQAALEAAVKVVENYPAKQHGYLTANPHDVAAQVRDEIAAAILALMPKTGK